VQNWPENLDPFRHFIHRHLAGRFGEVDRLVPAAAVVHACALGEVGLVEEVVRAVEELRTRPRVVSELLLLELAALLDLLDPGVDDSTERVVRRAIRHRLGHLLSSLSRRALMALTALASSRMY